MDELFDALKSESSYNSIAGIADVEALSNDERPFFDETVRPALALVAVHLRRITPDYFERITDTDIVLEITARVNVDKQYSQSDLEDVHTNCEQMIVKEILRRWYYSIGKADAVERYNNELIQLNANLSSALFRFYRPVDDGLGYGISCIAPDPYDTHCGQPQYGNPHHHHFGGCNPPRPSDNLAVVGIRSVVHRETDGRIIVTYTNGKQEEVGTVRSGKTNYELAVEAGYTGTLDEWLESLKIHYSDFTPEQLEELKGPRGYTGESTYEMAVRTGKFKGTEAEFLASLKGKDGEDGQDGVDGYDTTMKLPQLEVWVATENSGASSPKYLYAKIRGFAYGVGPSIPANAKIAFVRYAYQSKVSSANNRKNSKKKFFFTPRIFDSATAPYQGKEITMIEPTALFRKGGLQRLISVKELADYYIIEARENSKKRLVAPRKSRGKIIEKEEDKRGIRLRIGVCLVEPYHPTSTSMRQSRKQEGPITEFRVGKRFGDGVGTESIVNEVKL